jgi:hypothetical protein
MKILIIMILLFVTGCGIKPEPLEDDLPFDTNDWRYQWPHPQQREWMRQYKIRQSKGAVKWIMYGTS